VILAADGYQAIQLALREQPNVILLDISMPAGGGFSVHDRLRDLSSVSSVPIIYMSADHTAEPKALAAGAARFLAKPLRKEILIRTVHQVCPSFAQPPG
jgi:CheY-like chemotaxis protein